MERIHVQTTAVMSDRLKHVQMVPGEQQVHVQTVINAAVLQRVVHVRIMLQPVRTTQAMLDN